MTKIEWSDESWNPVCGCTKIATGCKNCYAERMANRLSGMAETCDARNVSDKNLRDYSKVVDLFVGGWNGEIVCRENQLEIPLHWKKPRRIFVCSMSDLFHPAVPFEFIDCVMSIITRCHQHIFQVLTKRPERMLYFMKAYHERAFTLGMKDIPDNLWLGTSISTPDDLWMLDKLRQIPAAIRFISFEPLLADLGKLDLSGIHQVIVGGESGPGASPMHPDWPRNIRDQCVAAGVPFFFKQWGRFKPSQKGTIAVKDDGSYQRDPTGKFEWKRGYAFEKMLPLGKKKAGRLLDGKEWNEYPKVRGER